MAGQNPALDDGEQYQYRADQCEADNNQSGYFVVMPEQQSAIPRQLRLVHGRFPVMDSAYHPHSYIDFPMNQFMHEPVALSTAAKLLDQALSSLGSLLGQGSQKMSLDMEYLITLIKTGAVPIMMCLTTLSGLSWNKKKFLQGFIEKAVKTDSSKPELASHYFKSIEEKVSKDGLSTFSFNVLGSYPFDDLMWLLATKRTSITLCFLSCLAQALKLRNVPASFLQLPDSELNSSFTNNNTNLGQQHKEWLFLEVTKRLRELKEQPNKLHLLESGISLVNVLNIGPSKAANRVLPFLVQFCKRSLPLVFVSPEDSQQLNKALTAGSPEENNAPVDHLLNAYKPKVKNLQYYAELGQHDDSATPPTLLWFVADELSYLENLKSDGASTLNMSVMNETRKKLEQIIVGNMTKYADTIPLRWIFLHSFLLTLKVSNFLITRAHVTDLAASCDIGMDDSEVEVFLKTFTSFGSLLYIPALTNVIIVEIEHFTDCLDKVYSYQDPGGAYKYGFVSAAAIDELARAEEIDSSLFMSVLKAFCFAVPIVKSRVALKHFEFDMDGQSFYIPSMRPLKSTNSPQVDSLYIRINPEYIPGDIQVFLVRHILKYSNCFLHPHLSIDATVIDVHSGKDCVPITVIDHGDVIELRLEKSNLPESYNCKEVCLLFVSACYAALEDLRLSLGDVEYHFALRCTGLVVYHNLPLNEVSGSACATCVVTQGSLREYWTAAVSDVYSKNNDLQKEQEHVPSVHHQYDKDILIAKLMREKIEKEDEVPAQFQEQELYITVQSEEEQHVTTESSEIYKCSWSSSQLIISADDIPKLSVVLQPVETDWYQLGQSLGVKESLLSNMKKKEDSTDDEQLKCLLEIWFEGPGERTAAQLEKALKDIGRDDVLSGLHDMKSLPVADEQLTDGHNQTSSIANKCVQFEDNLECLSQVHIAGKKLFLVQGEGAQLMDWEEYGLRIGVSEGTLSSSETAEIAVVALVGGQFLFPENTKLVSAVYALSVSGPLLKPLRLEVQHCVDLTSLAQTKYLKFAIAHINTPSFPYKFFTVEGGEFFIHNQYGSINRDKFCFLSILGEIYTEDGGGGGSGGQQHGGEEQQQGEVEQQHEAVEQHHGALEQQHGAIQQQHGAVEEEKESTVSLATTDSGIMINPAMIEHLTSSDENDHELPVPAEPSSATIVQQQQSTGIVEATKYAGLVYYEQRGVIDLVTFTAAKHLNALLKYIKQEHSEAEIGSNVFFFIKPSIDCINLILDAPQDEIVTGWSVKPQTKPCKLYQDDIDNFGSTSEYPLPPTCLVAVYGSSATDTVPILNYAVPVEGVVRPVTFIITRPLRTISSVTAATISNVSSGTATALEQVSTGEETDKVTKVIQEVLISRHTALKDLPNVSLPALADQLYTACLIGDQLKNQPSMEQFITEFKASIGFIKSLSQLQEHCHKFLKAFYDVRGSYAQAAIALQGDWNNAVNKLGNITGFIIQLD